MMIVCIFNTHFSVIDSNTKLKTNKNIEELNNTINNLIEYSTPCSIKEKLYIHCGFHQSLNPFLQRWSLVKGTDKPHTKKLFVNQVSDKYCIQNIYKFCDLIERQTIQ